MKYVMEILPSNLKEELHKIDTEKITELRLRVGEKCIVRLGIVEEILDVIVTKKIIMDILKNVTTSSIYAIQNELNNGFLTIKGGHRIGITGEVVYLDGKIKNIKNIYSMNIRIAREIKGISDVVLKYILRDKNFANTLIMSPPGCGKTTMLRDVIRELSNMGYNIGLIDERGEIASINNGEKTLDVGKRTDILSYCSKEQGITMLTRSMAPDIIATDEIGTKEEINAIYNASKTGVKMLFTIHGETKEDLIQNEEYSSLLKNGNFKNLIILDNKKGPGNIKEIYTDLESIVKEKQEELIWN